MIYLEIVKNLYSRKFFNCHLPSQREWIVVRSGAPVGGQLAANAATQQNYRAIQTSFVHRASGNSSSVISHTQDTDIIT